MFYILKTSKTEKNQGAPLKWFGAPRPSAGAARVCRGGSPAACLFLARRLAQRPPGRSGVGAATSSSLLKSALRLVDQCRLLGAEHRYVHCFKLEVEAASQIKVVK